MVFDLKVKSPCIGVCSTGIGDNVCRGCKRFTHEIINWNSYTENQKRSIQDRLDSLLAQVVQSHIRVNDRDSLMQQLELQSIHFNVWSDPHCWVFKLLQAGANQIEDLSDYGCALMPGFEAMKLNDIKEAIDKDFYVLSSVHYQRYFQ